MFENQFRISSLLSRQMCGELTLKEQEELEGWLNENKDNKDWAKNITSEEHLQSLLTSYYATNEKAVWDKLMYKMSAEPDLTIKKLYGYKIAIAAAVLFVLSFGAYFYYDAYRHQPTNDYAKHDLPPGTNSATLTLGNGRKIRLTDALNGELAKETGIRVIKNKEGQIIYEVSSSATLNSDKEKIYNTLSTANGEVYQIVLPDKTVVWLNAASSLRYPVTFYGLKEREVTLEGEAYFEIAHQATQPFKVYSNGQVVEDLGTAFNVNSYSDESNTRTTLVEGRVEVTSKLKQEVVLKPGQQSINSANSMFVIQADLEEATAWKNGDFNFKKGDDFQSAMRKIGRWYNVSIVYDVAPPANIDLGGWVSRKNNISKVLNLIESAVDVKLKLEGRRITVTK
jgi:transmembrane sensor